MARSVTGTDLYADDTTIYDIQCDKHILERNLQTALNELKVWCEINGMLLNTSKTKVMLISTRQKRASLNDNKIDLTFNDIDLEMTSGDKILGLNINENLLWNDHFNFVSKKVSTYLWLLSKIRYLLSIEHRKLFYNAYIQPHFDYCCVIWANSSNCNLSKITKLQRRACKIILADEYTDLITSLTKLNILSFDETVFLQKAKIMYKIRHNLAPDYLSELFHMHSNFLESTNNTMTLRSVTSKCMHVPRPKTEMFKGSLSYSGTIIWNSIPLNVRNLNSLTCFANQCLKWMKDQ